MTEAYLVDGVRTPIGRYGGALAARAGRRPCRACPLRALLARRSRLDLGRGRRRRLRLRQPGRRGQPQRRAHGAAAGRPAAVGAGRDGQPAVRLGPRRGRLAAARAIRAGEGDVMIAGGVESMSRAPFVHGQGGERLCARTWRSTTRRSAGGSSIPMMDRRHGTDSMPETAENVAEQFGISREDQDAFALRSQQRAADATTAGDLAQEITPVAVPVKARRPAGRRSRRAPAPDHLEELAASCQPRFALAGTVTAGNASGVNDGAVALLIASRAGDRAPRAGAAGAGRRSARPPAWRRASWASARSARPGKLLASDRLHHRRLRPDRAQRGLRRPGAGVPARARPRR